MPHSLYSGRARSYLIKNRIPFEERSTGHESFKAEVLPKGKLPTIPTLVTAEGEVIRDGGAIIEHFEAANGRPCQPQGPRQQVISALFDVIGTDGLLRPAMHYRWNFPEDNLEFVRYHFLHSQRDVPERAAKTEAMMNRMRHAAMIFGVTEQSQKLVEELYLEYLDALNAHFESYPYLLGWRPCIGDFGLLAPMYAHLGPRPASREPHAAARSGRVPMGRAHESRRSGCSRVLQCRQRLSGRRRGARDAGRGAKNTRRGFCARNAGRRRPYQWLAR